MDATLRARIARQLPPGRWAPEVHGRLADLVATYAGRASPSPFALFDADNTIWTGDLGDATLIHLAQHLALSPRLHTVLPEVIDVPAEGFGVSAPGRLFPAARVLAAQEAMTAAYRRAVAPSASTSDLLRAFSPDLTRPGGALHGDAAFAAAHRVYTGTLLATYNLLEARVGCLALDLAHARVATPLFAGSVRDFYGRAALDLGPFTRHGPGGQVDIVFPAVLDTGPGQQALRARAELGAYSQIAVWEAFDKTPAELARIGLAVWDASPDAVVPFDAIFPVDAAGASSPAPLHFAADASRFAAGAHPAAGVVLGATAMLHGTCRRPEIADLMAVMVRHGIVPAVVTASQVDLVRAVVDRHYGFAGHPVIGMLPVLHDGRYSADLTAPAPYRAGKVDAARDLARQITGREDTPPVLCAGDTNTDLELLAYSGDYRLFFDREMRPLMDLAEHLAAHGPAGRTLIQPPF